MRDRRDVGEEGFGTGEMLERRDAGQARCWRRGMRDRRDVGEEGCGTGEMLEKRDAGQERCWRGGMRDRRDAGQEGGTFRFLHETRRFQLFCLIQSDQI